MKTRSGNVKRSIFWVIISEILVQRQQVDVMHCNVIEILFHEQKTNIYKRRSIKPESVHLINNKDVMSDSLIRKKLVQMRNKLQQFFKAITERNNNCEFFAWT